MQRVASIDIGTNTILLLIAEFSGDLIEPLFEQETVVRLGEGLLKSGILSPEAMRRGLQTLTDYSERCRLMGVQTVFAAGTSALREAKNSGEFLQLAKERLNLAIEVISGQEEAQASFLAVAKDLREADRSILVIDVGGGSTELIFGKGERIDQWVSLPLGLVHFTEEFLVSDPVQEQEWETMAAVIRKHLRQIPHPRPPFLMVSVGGTGTTLASVEQGLKDFESKKIHHFVLTREAITRQLLLYRSRTIEGRKNIQGLPPNRADVILAGGTILFLAMEELKCPSVSISTHGVRYGFLYKKLSSLLKNSIS